MVGVVDIKIFAEDRASGGVKNTIKCNSHQTPNRFGGNSPYESRVKSLTVVNK